MTLSGVTSLARLFYWLSAEPLADAHGTICSAELRLKTTGLCGTSALGVLQLSKHISWEPWQHLLLCSLHWPTVFQKGIFSGVVAEG